MSHEAIRLMRLDIVRAKIKKKIPQEKIISYCCCLWGCSRRTMLEYIKVVELA